MNAPTADPTSLLLVKGQLRRQADDGCITCGLTIRSALTWAHVHADHGHDKRRVFRLCCTCHRLYDHDIIKTSEVQAAENKWARENRPQLTPWFQSLIEDMTAGLRAARPEVQHKGAQVRAGQTIRRRNAALKASRTRKQNALARAEDGGT